MRAPESRAGTHASRAVLSGWPGAGSSLRTAMRSTLIPSSLHVDWDSPVVAGGGDTYDAGHSGWAWQVRRASQGTYVTTVCVLSQKLCR